MIVNTNVIVGTHVSHMYMEPIEGIQGKYLPSYRISSPQKKIFGQDPD